jgi:hypothetical protein
VKKEPLQSIPLIGKERKRERDVVGFGLICEEGIVVLDVMVGGVYLPLFGFVILRCSCCMCILLFF